MRGGGVGGIRFGRGAQALACWKEALPGVNELLEKAWIHHEMGRAYMVLDNAVDALDHGLQARTFAEQSADDEWQLNTNLLVAQAHGTALPTFPLPPPLWAQSERLPAHFREAGGPH